MDREYNFDEQIAEENDKTPDPEETNKVLKMPRPFVSWEVGEETFRLKLTSAVIQKLEATFKTSLMNAVLDNGIPTVGVMVAVLQAGLQKYNHGIKSKQVEDLFDAYIDSGKTQIDLLREVIYPLMGDAGFFTATQVELMTREMGELDSQL